MQFLLQKHYEIGSSLVFLWSLKQTIFVLKRLNIKLHVPLMLRKKIATAFVTEKEKSLSAIISRMSD